VCLTRIAYVPGIFGFLDHVFICRHDPPSAREGERDVPESPKGRLQLRKSSASRWIDVPLTRFAYVPGIFFFLIKSSYVVIVVMFVLLLHFLYERGQAKARAQTPPTSAAPLPRPKTTSTHSTAPAPPTVRAPSHPGKP